MKAKYQLLLCLFIMLISSQQLLSQEKTSRSTKRHPATIKPIPKKQQDGSKTSKITFLIIDASQNSYGYDVFVNGKKTIHQTTIPGYQGLKGFSNRSDAAKVAELVVKKMNAGQMPPTVTKIEIDQLIK